MKIYISGPISGLPNYNFEAFREAEENIAEKGHVAINPHTVCTNISGGWDEYMRADIRALMTANAILMLPGWEKSRGAIIEFWLATELGMRVFFSIDDIKIAY
jgi:hypothetical protein